eukprot:TRINITY_DN11829_c1_g1_i1.p1 TRINITY_DN11829_c1_g1~~TRINITY_DN11829_c1_g1_i1.p1  ORF type:complete len:580 (+),score=197.11 TRINITY_DN11829_c1_g1_i1:83-1741(+)
MKTLTEKIKERQRANPEFKEAWEKYCEAHGRRMFDPSLHEAQFLRRALDELPGMPGDEKGGSGAEWEQLVAQCKELQRGDRDWRTAWQKYCEENSDGTRDPAKHETDFLRRALEELGTGGVPSGGGGGPSRPASGGKGAGRRARVGDGAELVAADGPEAEEKRRLVQIVKERRQDSSWRTRWADYCEEHSNGMRDPERHDAEFLSRAIDDLKGDTPLGDDHAELVEKVKELQRHDLEWRTRWGRLCDTMSDGSRDPQLHECSFLRRALDKLGSSTTREGPSQALVDRVKELQRDDAVWRTRWADYCSEFGDGSRDPALYPDNFLRRALRDLEEPDAATRKGLRSGDATALIETVKEKQRQDPAWKRRWGEYCDEHSDGTRDPTLHDAGFLRRALRALSTPAARSMEEARRHEEIRLLVDARRKAQRSRAFERADRLRDMLWEMGVEVDDTKKLWRSDDGLRGSIDDEEAAPRGARRGGGAARSPQRSRQGGGYRESSYRDSGRTGGNSYREGYGRDSYYGGGGGGGGRYGEYSSRAGTRYGGSRGAEAPGYC